MARRWEIGTRLALLGQHHGVDWEQLAPSLGCVDVFVVFAGLERQPVSVGTCEKMSQKDRIGFVRPQEGLRFHCGWVESWRIVLVFHNLRRGECSPGHYHKEVEVRGFRSLVRDPTS